MTSFEGLEFESHARSYDAKITGDDYWNTQVLGQIRARRYRHDLVYVSNSSPYSVARDTIRRRIGK